MYSDNLLHAIDPVRSAVVNACAGSGKTWLLVSRLIRLLLEGVNPAELLAITFTRKAAEEMRTRLYDWLAYLAVAPDEAVLTFLKERGFDAHAAQAVLLRARRLLEAVLHSQPGPMITTYHGWFLNLLSRAPLTRRAPANLIEDVALLRDEAWLTWAESLRKPKGVGQAAALEQLLADLPMDSVRTLLFALLDKRAEGWAWMQGCADPVSASTTQMAALSGLAEQGDVVAALWAEPGLGDQLLEFRGLLERNGRGHGKSLDRAGLLGRALEDRSFDDLCAALLKQDGVPFADYKAGKTMEGRLGMTGMARFFELHGLLSGRVVAAREALAEQAAMRLNRLALTAGLGLIDHYQALKRQRDGLDFTDAEWLALQLLSDPDESAALLAKLDARWKHVLLDEFQDANPLQWRALTAWLSAYGADEARPTVFMVGDPKQSIYRFRRAEPRLFDAAADWLRTGFDAVRVEQNMTRRCAPRVVAWVNAVFDGLGDAYPGYERHLAHQVALPGWCELIEVPQAAPQMEKFEGLRDPLTQAPAPRPDKRAAEAEALAVRILELVGRMAVAEDGGRPACFGDILVLAASRTGLDVFEAAFKAAGIPYLGSRRGGLLDTLEVSDLLAVLGFLVMPHDNLKLAQTLKCPLFGFSDQDLLCLKAAGEGAWIDRLRQWTEGAGAPVHVRRALGLLDGWLAAAGHLPPHDLLDRIFHEGEIEARYAASVPDRLQASVLANLRGLMEMSLSLGSGRFPSLPRFFDELQTLRTAGNEAPDEPPAATGDAVRMLTIHAAKGLEAPIVFLIKADEERRSQDHYGVLIDWPPEAGRPVHFSLYGPSALRGHARDALFDRERAQEEREQLNLLYVAMTRARQALIVTGLAEAKAGTWMARLRTAMADAGLDGLPEMRCADSGKHPSRERVVAAGESDRIEPIPVGQRRVVPTPEIQSGIRVHRYLELHMAGLPDEAIRLDLGLDNAGFEAVRQQATTILEMPEAARFLTVGTGTNELEYVAADGQLRRIDRVVELDGEVWVLDYKTGRPDDAYLAQLAEYRSAVAVLHPGKHIRSALLYADGRVQEVE